MQHQKLFNLFVLSVSIWVTGCATRPITLPGSALGGGTPIRLESAGRIQVHQPIDGGMGACRKLRNALALEIHRYWMGQVPVHSRCISSGRELVFLSQDNLPAGDYALRWSKLRSTLKVKEARVSVLYRNGDFAASPDHRMTGAKPLGPDGQLNGAVHYHRGDQTDWIRLSGKKASVLLTFLPEQAAHVRADVFRKAQGPLQHLGRLTKGNARRFALGDSDLFVRVRSHPSTPKVDYRLIRRDSQARKVAHVTVMDCYPVGDGQAIALLRVSDGVNVNDDILISASDTMGNRVALGKCRVMNVDGNEASCKVPYSDKSEWTRFRADAVYPAGESA